MAFKEKQKADQAALKAAKANVASGAKVSDLKAKNLLIY